MNAKRQRFCEEYLKDLNGKASAIRAGYAEKHATFEASKLLAIPEIAKYVAKLKKETSERNQITHDELIRDLAEIKNINIADLYNKKGELKNINELPKEFTKCIQEVQITKIGIKYKFYSRTEAIEKLARHLGFYEKDNRQSKPEIKIELPFNINVESREKSDS